MALRVGSAASGFSVSSMYLKAPGLRPALEWVQQIVTKGFTFCTPFHFFSTFLGRCRKSDVKPHGKSRCVVGPYRIPLQVSLGVRVQGCLPPMAGQSLECMGIEAAPQED